jgi:hypothetical protein
MSAADSVRRLIRANPATAQAIAAAANVAELDRLIGLLAAHRPGMWPADAIEEARTVGRGDLANALVSLRALVGEIPR